MHPGLQKFILTACSCLLAAVVIAFGVILHQTYQEYRIFQKREMTFDAQLSGLKADIDAKQEYLDRLQDDPVFLERVIRERLGYSKPGDLLYRFPEDR